VNFTRGFVAMKNESLILVPDRLSGSNNRKIASARSHFIQSMNENIRIQHNTYQRKLYVNLL